MVEAVMLWNEPNNLSHWDFEIDSDWKIYAGMVMTAAASIAAENSRVRRVCPTIPPFVRRAPARFSFEECS